MWCTRTGPRSRGGCAWCCVGTSTAVADLTDDEAAELGPLTKRVSAAVQEVVGCDKTYVVQLAEHPDHPHVHFHVIPRPRDLADEHQGPRVFELLGVPAEHAVPEARRDEIAGQIASRLEASEPG